MRTESEVERAHALVLDIQAASGASPFEERHRRYPSTRIDYDFVSGVGEIAAGDVAAAVQMDD